MAVKSPTRRLPPGITRTAHGFRCAVRVRPFPLETGRFPPEATIEEMKDWLYATRARLRTARTSDDRTGRGTPAAATTLADDVALYLDAYLGDVHPSTRTNRERYLRAWVTVFPNRSRQSLSTDEIAQALADFGRDGIVRDKPLSADTLYQVRLALYRLYEALNTDAEVNPVRRVPVPKATKPEPRGVSYEIVKAILAQLKPGTPTTARLLLMAYTGLRPCEVMRIQPTDWNVTAATLLTRTAKGGPAATLKLVPQAEQALQELARLKAWGPYWAAPVSRAFQAAVTAAGYPHLVAKGDGARGQLVPYDLRHCMGTLIYQQTGDLKAVKETLRHSTLRLSERYMAGAVSPMLDRVHSELTAYFGAPPPRPKPRLVKRATR